MISLCFVSGLRVEAPSCPRPLESRSSVDNCTKNLFCSPNTKRGFTRHHSLVKLAKSIQEDRRKINSAPSSPSKITSECIISDVFISTLRNEICLNGAYSPFSLFQVMRLMEVSIRVKWITSLRSVKCTWTSKLCKNVLNT